MSATSTLNEKQAKMEMLLAFVLYKDKGIVAVQRMYPQHVSFVLAHQSKSTTEVKRELQKHPFLNMSFSYGR